MKQQLLITSVVLFVSLGCGNPSENGNSNQLGGQNELVSHTGIQLNNGEKWKANPETTEGINTMAGMINQFPDNAVLADYHALKPQVESAMQGIFDKCTMEGEAHEQLHAYLMPMNKMIEYLGSKDIEFCKMAVREMKQHLTEYGTYFE